MSLFSRLAKLSSREGDRLQFEMVGTSNNEIRVRVTPDLGPTPENASDEEIELRTLMATPITISGTPAEVDELLSEYLDKRVETQTVGADALATLTEKMAQAAHNAKAAKPSAASAKATTPKAKKSESKAPEGPAKAPTLEDSF